MFEEIFDDIKMMSIILGRSTSPKWLMHMMQRLLPMMPRPWPDNLEVRESRYHLCIGFNNSRCVGILVNTDTPYPSPPMGPTY